MEVRVGEKPLLRRDWSEKRPPEGFIWGKKKGFSFSLFYLIHHFREEERTKQLNEYNSWTGLF